MQNVNVAVPSTLTTGAASDVSALGRLRAVQFSGSSGDSVRLDGSLDGTSWSEVRTYTITGDDGTYRYGLDDPSIQYRITRLIGLTSATFDVTGPHDGAAGTPSGSGREVQFNSSGVFGSASTLLYTSAGGFINGHTEDPLGYDLAGAVIAARTGGQCMLGSVSAHSASAGAALVLASSRGTLAAPTATQSGDTLATVGGYGYGASGYGSAVSILSMEAAETFTDSAQGSTASIYTTPIGSTSAALALTVDSTQFVGIGIAVPTQRLHSKTSTAGAFAAHFQNGANGATAHGVLITAGHNSTTGSDFVRFARPDGTVIGAVDQDGATTVAYLTTSDERRKADIMPTARGLAELLQVQVRDFRWRGGDGTVHTGFIAQELAEVVPAAVRKGGEDPTTEPWQVDASKLVPLLVAALQDLANDVRDLRAQLADR